MPAAKARAKKASAQQPAPVLAKTPTASTSNHDGVPESLKMTPSAVRQIASLFPLTHPLPSPLDQPDLIPIDDVSLEQDLLLNDLNPRSWRAYIDHVVTSNQPTSSYSDFPPDENLSSAQIRLLGPLASSQARLALRRITFVYERALSRFSTGTSSYSLWRDYLLQRMHYVLGKPKGGVDAFFKRQVQEGKQTLDVGPQLVEAEEARETWQGGLDGRVGFREWNSLAAVFERALLYHPKMPRIWLLYFQLFLHPLCPATLAYTHARRTFDRALRTLPPSLHLRMWKPYLRWAEQKGGETCLRVWRRYLRVDPSLTERYVRILLALRDEAAEDEGEDGQEEGGVPARARTLEAAKLLLNLAHNAIEGRYTSPEGKSPYQLLVEWLELCERFPEEVGYEAEQEAAETAEAAVVRSAPAAKAKGDRAHPVQKGKNGIAQPRQANTIPQTLRACDLDPHDRTPLPVRKIVVGMGIARFPDQAGRLWSGLATYYIKRGELDEARDTFEEGMAKVVTVRDFTQIFDAYAETSENVIGFLMEELAEEVEDDDEADTAGESREDREQELDRRMKDFEGLMERRPFLVNDVLLRRNPHDVQEWEKRVALHGDDDEMVVKTYTDAIEAINPRKATANFHQLFINFARFYEEGGSRGRRLAARAAAASDGQGGGGDDGGEENDEHDEAPEPDLESARKIFERATTVPFRRVEDLAEIWCEWAEMEVRHDHFHEALRVLARATAAPRTAAQAKAISYYDDSLAPQARLFKSLKVWSFYVDLEESIGSVDGARGVYDRIMELKIANPQVIINYAAFLEENRYFEDAFRVYERGVEAFTYPVAFEIWNVYLSKFVKRYGASKIERARDLFEQALESCPPKFAKPLYLKYGALEEEHGLAKRAMNIYERATQNVGDADRFDMFVFYIAKVTESFGLAATRPIYQRAIEVLPDRQTAEMCLRFAQLERKLGEIDRARAIFAHASQFCDPRTQPHFWKEWNAFEIDTGSEDTFREFLRIKRSVQAQFNTEASYLAASALAASQRAAASSSQKQRPPGSGVNGAAAAAANPMAQAEAAALASTGAAPASAGPAFVRATTTAQQPPVEAAEERNAEAIGGRAAKAGTSGGGEGADGQHDDDEDLM